jgi:hypothetical protein
MKLMLDTIKYQSKPHDVWRINKDILAKPVDISIQDLARSVVNGQTFIPSYLKPNSNGLIERKIDYWYQQQVIALDFDNEEVVKDSLGKTVKRDNKVLKKKVIHMTTAQAIEEFKNMAAFLYTTFSHTDSHPKFRVVFVLDKILKNYNTYKKVIESLLKKYPYADQACKDGTRIFYGGKDLIEIDYDNRLVIGDVLSNSQGVFDRTKSNIYNMSDTKPLKPKNNISHINQFKQNSINNNHIDLIVNRKIDKLQSIINPKSTILHNMKQVEEYIKKQDLRLFLGVSSSGSFRDLFHDESSPSASIFTSNIGNGHQLYKCHSASNEFCGTIFQITERLLKCSNIEAEEFLMQVYKITIEETETQKEMKKMLDANKRLLMSPNLSEIYPYLEKVVGRYTYDLYILFDLVKEFLPAGDDPKLMFFHSIREIAKHMRMSKSSTSDRLNLFVFLELLLKPNEDEIPAELLEQIKAWQDQKGHKYHNSFYEIPNYSFTYLDEINMKCKEWVEKGCTLKSVTYEGILRNFGLEEADRVFPQDKGKEIRELNEVVAMKIKQSALEILSDKGWTTEKEVLYGVTLFFKGQQRFKKNQLKRCLGELLDEYDLERVRLDKKLKEKLKIKTKGYPFIIKYK